MKCTLIGIGCGWTQMTMMAQTAINESQLIIGAQRLLDMVPCRKTEQIAEYRSQEIASLLQERAVERACVLYSGDSGFYSGAAGLLPLLQDIERMQVAVLPGISSLQEFAALLGEPWQDWRLCSAHGTACDPVAEVMQGQRTFFLTSGTEGPGQLCAALVEAGLGSLQVAVGENLGTAEMQCWQGTAAECAARSFAPLNVMLVAAAPRYPVRTPGIPDDEFLRGSAGTHAQGTAQPASTTARNLASGQNPATRQIPMTKQVVRAAILAQLAVTPDDMCWDVGAGTGSVSVELALHARQVWAVEQIPEAVQLIHQNRERFCAWNLHVVEGTAPEVLVDLPRPDVVFVGGSSGQMEAILQAAVQANPQVRLCISAIALETLQQAVHGLEQLGYTPAVTQIAVSQTRAAGELHMLLAQNPVFLITVAGDQG